MSGKEKPPRTRAEWVEAEIRGSILSGELVPGEKLNIAALSENLQVSPTPLREALQRLAGNGLITISPQRGAFVTELTTADLTDIYSMRMLLEPKAAEESTKRTTDSWRKRVLSAHERTVELAQARSVSDVVARENAHRELHLVISENCGFPRLLSSMRELMDHSARYRIAVRSQLGSRPEVIEEHADIVDAILKSDSESTGRLVLEHVRHTYEAALAYLEELSSTPADPNDSHIEDPVEVGAAQPSI